MAINPLPDPPSTNDPANFDERADEFLGALPDFADEAEAARVQIVDTGAQVAADADEVAGNAAVAAAAANFHGDWSGLSGAAAPPYSVRHAGRHFLLLSAIASLAASEPGVASEWEAIDYQLGRRTTFAGASLTIAATDAFSLLQFTGAVASVVTMATAVEMGEATFDIFNSGTEIVAFAWQGSDTVDGLSPVSSFYMYPGELRRFYSDGVSAYTSVVLKPFSLKITAGITFVYPPGYKAIEGEGWGAGGGGGWGSSNGGAGGGGGACTPFVINAAEYAAGAAETLTVGAGGAGAASTNNAGGNGGNSTWGSKRTFFAGAGGENAYATGGYGGGALGAAAVGSPGSPSNTGDNSGFGSSTQQSQSTIYGGAPGGVGSSSGTAGIGGKSLWGGGGGGGGTGGSGQTPGPGGGSVYGGAGGRGGVNGGLGATTGAAPGGGGGGGGNSAAGAGARGEIHARGRL